MDIREFCIWIVSTLQQCIFKIGMITIVKIATLRDFYDMHLAPLHRWYFKFPLIPLRSTMISVGLFSREEESQYSWLINKLQSKRRCIEYVHPFQISNSNRGQFQEAVMKCQFAILYHSKTRGRINITDVTDARYDEELDTLSKNLGKKNIMVVVDHLDQSKDDHKAAILWNQPSIENKARALFLFSTEETMPHDTKALSDTGEKKFQAIMALIAECILYDYCTQRVPAMWKSHCFYTTYSMLVFGSVPATDWSKENSCKNYSGLTSAPQSLFSVLYSKDASKQENIKNVNQAGQKLGTFLKIIVIEVGSNR